MTATYDLKFPIVQTLQSRGGEAREQTIDQITLRRPRAKDLRALEKTNGKIAQSLTLIATLAGLPITTIDELDAADIEGIGELIGDFFPGRQPTGQDSLEA